MISVTKRGCKTVGIRNYDFRLVDVDVSVSVRNRGTERNPTKNSNAAVIDLDNRFNLICSVPRSHNAHFGSYRHHHPLQ